mmetsp:Transcript_18198/g.17539  ORF Transcript_18198/g.17539 Transcript_18198/m.17539 type:complete len:88 (+) Transcript_18198:226-489(+)
MALAAIPGWIHSISKGVSNLLRASGYIKAHMQRDSTGGEDFVYNRAKLGFGLMAAAAFLSPTTSGIDYSLLYSQGGMPDPQSNLILE